MTTNSEQKPVAEEDFAIIHLRVPRATKARWVRISRDEGKKLTDWIVARVEAQSAQADCGAGDVLPGAGTAGRHG